VGHGTFIAGIIGATKGNGVGIAGVAPGVTFIPVKCFSSLFSTPDAEVSGIYAAVDTYHADVINLSSGMPENNKDLKKAVEYAISKNVIVISTVGNEGDDTLNYPGACESVIAVGSVDKNMNVSEFSNKNESVFVVAPGEKVASLRK
jgi:subtilisin family serine protease